MESQTSNVYHQLIRYCRFNKLHGEDCVVFVQENDEGFQIIPMSITFDGNAELYWTEMKVVFEKGPLKDIVHIQRMYNTLAQDWMRQVEMNGLEEGLRVFKYIDGELSMLTREGKVSLSSF
jgi:hypothetical protein